MSGHVSTKHLIVDTLQIALYFFEEEEWMERKHGIKGHYYKPDTIKGHIAQIKRAIATAEKELPE